MRIGIVGAGGVGKTSIVANLMGDASFYRFHIDIGMERRMRLLTQKEKKIPLGGAAAMQEAMLYQEVINLLTHSGGYLTDSPLPVIWAYTDFAAKTEIIQENQYKRLITTIKTFMPLYDLFFFARPLPHFRPDGFRVVNEDLRRFVDGHIQKQMRDGAIPYVELPPVSLEERLDMVRNTIESLETDIYV